MHKKILVAIIAIALFLRIFSISNHPSGFTPDEASFGYDAYSILKTGRDQWGNTLPLSLKSFGDYKLPLYTYITIPSIAVFGLNEFSVRLPNALAGSLAVLATYFLVKQIGKQDEKLALTSAFFLAVSPWHIPLSRGAFEANLTAALLPLTLLFYLKGRQNSKNYIFASVFFVLNIFSYHSARFVTPIFLAFIVTFSRKNLIFNKNLKIATIIAGLGLTIVLLGMLTGNAARLQSAGIYSISDSVYSSRFGAIIAGEPELIAKLFNNKVTYLKEIFFDNYLQYFSPRFFFTNGPSEGTYGMVPGRGALYTFEIITLFGFIVGTIKGKVKNTSWLIIWLLLAPIPAALALGPGFAANRAAIMMPGIQIISAAGAIYLYSHIKQKLNTKTLLLASAAIFTFSFLGFAEDYWYQQPSKQSSAMIFGSKEIFKYTKEHENDYNEIIIAKSLSEAHIFAAFYNKIAPAEFQKESQSWNFESIGVMWVDQLPKYTLNNYTFRDFDWKVEKDEPNILLIDRPERFSEDVNKTHVVRYPDGSDAYWIVETANSSQ